MNVRGRLSRLERIADMDGAGEKKDARRSEEEWLQAFEAACQQGCFDNLPHVPAVLAKFRQALAQAKAQIDPPFDPPPSFEPSLPNAERCRLWRAMQSFPAVDAGLTQLLGIAEQVASGKEQA